MAVFSVSEILVAISTSADSNTTPFSVAPAVVMRSDAAFIIGKAVFTEREPE